MAFARVRSAPYQPGQSQEYKVSRSKIELFKQCPRCFWLDVRHKITRPSSPPFNINKTIDDLYKKEFDEHRRAGTPHPIMTENGLKGVKPFDHKDIDIWRDTFKGVSVLHGPTNLLVYGGVDDVWVDAKGSLIIVDYKATSKNKEVSLDSDWQISYKRQIEVYQWLFKNNGFNVSETAYFVYTNARTDAQGFGDKLEFKTKLIDYNGQTDWIEPTLAQMKACMEGDMPEVGVSIMGGECEHCSYARARLGLTLEALKKR